MTTPESRPRLSDERLRERRNELHRRLNEIDLVDWRNERDALDELLSLRPREAELQRAAKNVAENYGEDGMCENGFQKLRVVPAHWQAFKTAFAALTPPAASPGSAEAPCPACKGIGYVLQGSSVPGHIGAHMIDCPECSDTMAELKAKLAAEAKAPRCPSGDLCEWPIDCASQSAAMKQRICVRGQQVATEAKAPVPPEFHVDPINGDDANPGTHEKPLRTTAEAQRRWWKAPVPPAAESPELPETHNGKPRHSLNVCAIRRKSDGYWWECSHEHGAGWNDKRIRQAWTFRAAVVEVHERKLEGVEIVELASIGTADTLRAALKGEIEAVATLRTECERLSRELARVDDEIAKTLGVPRDIDAHIRVRMLADMLEAQRGKAEAELAQLRASQAAGATEAPTCAPLPWSINIKRTAKSGTQTIIVDARGDEVARTCGETASEAKELADFIVAKVMHRPANVEARGSDKETR